MNKSQNVIFRNLVDIPSTTHATFGLYRYPAKFIPHVVAYILENYGKPNMKVFDPFGGYGTVGVVSKVYGYDYELWDLNPIIETLHPVAIMNPVKIDVQEVINEIKKNKKEFVPDWSRLSFWYPEEFLPFLYKIWGYYHSLEDKKIKSTLVIPLLKVSRYFSYDDMQRQKLSKSSRSEKRVKDLLNLDWGKKFFDMLSQEMNKVIKRVNEYQALNPKNTKTVIRGGIDTLKQNLTEKKDILITSPPYLQSQEYIRQAKLDLFWLGYSEKKVKEFGKLELPYREVEPCEIHSETYLKYRNKLKDKHIQKMYDKYFWSVLGAFTRLEKDINKYMFIFVGHTSARGHSIPLDTIIIEHLKNYGWEHEKTFVDKIVSRRLFSYKINPASKMKDNRTNVENLVVLRKIKQ